MPRMPQISQISAGGMPAAAVFSDDGTAERPGGHKMKHVFKHDIRLLPIGLTFHPTQCQVDRADVKL